MVIKSTWGERSPFPSNGRLEARPPRPPSRAGHEPRPRPRGIPPWNPRRAAPRVKPAWRRSSRRPRSRRGFKESGIYGIEGELGSGQIRLIDEIRISDKDFFVYVSDFEGKNTTGE